MKVLNLEDKILAKDKKIIVKILNDIFHACFTKEVDNCETYAQLKRVMFNNANEVSKYLGVEDKSDEVDDLEDKIDDLELEVAILKDKLQHIRISEEDTLLTNWKQEIFCLYADKFSPLELEERLKF